MTKHEKQIILQILRASCEDAIDGTWDCTPDGFREMIKYIDQLAKSVGVKLTPKQYDYARVCDMCQRGMNEGYVVSNGDEYYCSDTCVQKNYTTQQWNQLYHKDIGYWTTWGEEDMEYIGDIDGNIIREI